MKPILHTLAALALAGCASSATVDSWRGRNLDDLQFVWGPPARTSTLADGRRMAMYEHIHYVQGNSYQCTVTFFADASGSIVRTDTAGNIGGCNALLRSKQGAF
jgi:hypothetical protein